MKIISISVLSFLMLAFHIGCSTSDNELKVTNLISNNMVLQRDRPLPFWGTARPGTMIKVLLADQVKMTKTKDDGKWQVSLDAMPAGGPFELFIIGDDTLSYKNVMLGEVWICSGQSNMEMAVDGWGKVDNYKEEVASANYPDIRLFQVRHTLSTIPLNTVNAPGWEVCSPQTISPFSAVAYFFGRKLHKELNIPIGLIHTSWGGTPAEAWTSAESLEKMSDFKNELALIQETDNEKKQTMEEYQEELIRWEESIRPGDAGFKDGKPIWHNPDLDVSDWKTMEQPTRWENAGYPYLDGIMWFRKDITLPAAMTGSDLTLHLGPVNDIDITWFNGEKVGSESDANMPRIYKIPAAHVKEGKNVIVVNVQDIGYSGGLWGRPDQLFIENNKGEKISLAGDWLCKIGFDTKVLGPKPQSPQDPNRPTVLFNAMIHPLIPFALRGAIWYQGESNAGRAYQYRTLFPTMIKDWREQWDQGDFPFLFVQLANFNPLQTEPQEDDWAELREAQLMTLSQPNTGMASAIDIGDAYDIHPTNKQEVGRRLALNALHLTYEQDIVYSGPIFQRMEVEDSQIRLYFEHVDGGLTGKDGKSLEGFAIAGPDKKFIWGRARIDGETIVVNHRKIKNPVAVRYAWAANPIGNLYNKAGLPASPFRTDSWPGITQRSKTDQMKVLDLNEAVIWLEYEADRLIRTSRRVMHDGTAAFPPQVGIGYEAFWLRDYAYTLEGSIHSYSDTELLDACNLFVNGIREDGAAVDCIKFDGTLIYKPGFGTMGKNPVADGSQFTVNVAWHTYQKTKNEKLLDKIIHALIKTLEAVPRNPETHLVHIAPGKDQERCPYGFTDTIGKQGDLLFCSLLYVQASRQISDLLAALGRKKESTVWMKESEMISESIRNVFWDSNMGLFRAATIQCKEHDVWGSAFAVYLGVAGENQAKSIAEYFKNNYSSIVKNGQIRHLPGGVYWEKALCKPDTYQNGAYWGTPTGWFVYTLDLVDPILADQTVIDMVNDCKKHGAHEWISDTEYKLRDYLASASLPLAGIRAMIERRNKLE